MEKRGAVASAPRTYTHVMRCGVEVVVELFAVELFAVELLVVELLAVELFAVGYSLPRGMGHSAAQLAAGLAGVLPCTLDMLGDTAANGVARFALNDPLHRVPVARRFAGWLDAEGSPLEAMLGVQLAMAMRCATLVIHSGCIIICAVEPLAGQVELVRTLLIIVIYQGNIIQNPSTVGIERFASPIQSDGSSAA